MVSVQMEIDSLLTYKEYLYELIHSFNVEFASKERNKDDKNNHVRMMFGYIL